MDQEPSEPPRDPTDEVGRRADGEQTHQEILDAAMRLASIHGLGSLTFGSLARELDISKSGVFAHFRSKQHLQRETIAAARDVYEREVLAPGMSAPEGLPRLEALCEAYLSYVERGVFPGGCFFAQLLAEYDAREGAIHDELAADQRGWLALLESQITAAQDAGDLTADTAPQQLAFEVYAALELANYLATLYRDDSFVERGRVAVNTVITAAKVDRANV